MAGVFDILLFLFSKSVEAQCLHCTHKLHLYTYYSLPSFESGNVRLPATSLWRTLSIATFTAWDIGSTTARTARTYRMALTKVAAADGIQPAAALDWKQWIARY